MAGCVLSLKSSESPSVRYIGRVNVPPGLEGPYAFKKGKLKSIEGFRLNSYKVNWDLIKRK